jgi:hypothetical protein
MTQDIYTKAIKELFPNIEWNDFEKAVVSIPDTVLENLKVIFDDYVDKDNWSFSEFLGYHLIVGMECLSNFAADE